MRSYNRGSAGFFMIQNQNKSIILVVYKNVRLRLEHHNLVSDKITDPGT